MTLALLGRRLPRSGTSGTAAVRAFSTAVTPYGIEPRRDDIRKTLEAAMPAFLRKETIPVRSSPNPAIDRLAELNGYRRIQMDASHRVHLAEGVLALPRKTLTDYTVYSKPSPIITTSHEDTKNNRTKLDLEEKHPSFLEEDFTLFRIIQGSVEDSLNRREERIKKQVHRTREQMRRLVNNVVDAVYTKPRRALLGSQRVKIEQKKQPKIEDAIVPLNSPSKLPGNENLLIISNVDGRVLLVEEIPPEYKLLALSSAYHLSHGRAASVIYTSFIMFGAAPLAYRSLIYALDYPGLAQIVVASVIGSVSWNLWASRNGGKTRQSLVVMNAVASRIVARDDAALSVLRDAGMNALVEAVLEEYLERLGGPRHTRLQPLKEAVRIAEELGLLVQEDGELVAMEWNESSPFQIMKLRTKPPR